MIAIEHSEPPSPDSWPGCWPFHMEPWENRVYPRNLINCERQSFKKAVLTDGDFALRLSTPGVMQSYLCRIRKVTNGKT